MDEVCIQWQISQLSESDLPAAPNVEWVEGNIEDVKQSENFWLTEIARKYSIKFNRTIPTTVASKSFLLQKYLGYFWHWYEIERIREDEKRNTKSILVSSKYSTPRNPDKFIVTQISAFIPIPSDILEKKEWHFLKQHGEIIDQTFYLNSDYADKTVLNRLRNEEGITPLQQEFFMFISNNNKKHKLSIYQDSASSKVFLKHVAIFTTFWKAIALYQQQMQIMHIKTWVKDNDGLIWFLVEWKSQYTIKNTRFESIQYMWNNLLQLNKLNPTNILWADLIYICYSYQLYLTLAGKNVIKSIDVDDFRIQKAVTSRFEAEISKFQSDVAE